MIQLSTDVRNEQLDCLETVVGASPYLDVRTGAQPADCSQSDTGTELEHMALPSDWLQAAAAGVKSKNGTWSGTADASGVAAHFRIKDNSDTDCHMQGSITGPGGGGDMELDDVNITTGQTITVTTFSLTAGNP